MFMKLINMLKEIQQSLHEQKVAMKRMQKSIDDIERDYAKRPPRGVGPM